MAKIEVNTGHKRHLELSGVVMGVGCRGVIRIGQDIFFSFFGVGSISPFFEGGDNFDVRVQRSNELRVHLR